MENPFEKYSSEWWKFQEDMQDWYMDEGAYYPLPELDENGKIL